MKSNLIKACSINSIACCILFLCWNTFAQAATYSFTNNGLNYTIDTSNPLFNTITFAPYQQTLSAASISNINSIFQFSGVTADFSVAETVASGSTKTSILGPANANGLLPIQNPFETLSSPAVLNWSFTDETSPGVTQTMAGTIDMTGQLFYPYYLDGNDFPASAPLVGAGPTFIYTFDGTLTGQLFGQTLQNPILVSASYTSQGLSVSWGAVPVPSSLYLLGSGLLGLFGISRRKRRNSDSNTL